jgi:TIR domain
MILPKQPSRVFLIYAHNDKEVVHKLYHRMVRDRINVWLDVEKLKPGQGWQYEIRKALLKSDLVIVCLSHSFNKQNGFRYEELKLALEKANVLSIDEVFIIPIRLEKCDMPESLRHLQRVDLFEAGGYKKLILALQEPARKK